MPKPALPLRHPPRDAEGSGGAGPGQTGSSRVTSNVVYPDDSIHLALVANVQTKSVPNAVCAHMRTLMAS